MTELNMMWEYIEGIKAIKLEDVGVILNFEQLNCFFL